MEEIIEEPVALVGRVAALDLGKATLTACVRVPHETKPQARRQEARTCTTTTRSLLGRRDWLVCHGVTPVVMEAASASWKPPFYLLEDDIAGCWVAGARDVKNAPGRPQTGKLDAVWLAKLAARGMIWPSFIPPRPPRQLRDLTRYRRTLTHERTREMQRAEKLLEDAQVKLSSVIPNIFGTSGRDMLDALIAGQRDPHVLARLARGKMRAKTSALAEARTGHVPEHHAFLLAMMLDRIDALTPRQTPSPPGSNRRSPRSPARWPSWMRSPGSASSAPRRSSPRSAPRCPASPPPGTWSPGPSSRPRPASPPAAVKPPPPAKATPGWAAPPAKPPYPPPAPAPSWPPATGGSSNDGATNAPWPPWATPSSPSPGTCHPTPIPASPTSAPTGTTTSPRSGANASSSPNWHACPG
jgi:transposase